MRQPDRREFLQRLGRGALAAPLASLALAPAAARREPNTRVVWILAAGGERTQDTFDAMPPRAGYAALLNAGTLYRTARSLGQDRDQALIALLTGREGQPNAPRLFDLARNAGFAMDDQVFVSNRPGGGTALLGATPAPLRFRPAAARNPALREWLTDRVAKQDGLGAPPSAALEALAKTLGSALAPRTARLLAELTLKPEGTTGVGHQDLDVLSTGHALLTRLRPRLLVLHLEEAAIGAESEAQYQEVLLRRSEGLERLLAAIAGDPELEASTTVVHSVERGRNRKATDGRLMDQDDDPAVSRCALAFAGPGIARNNAPRRAVRAIDAMPTIARILGLPTANLDGRPVDLPT